jgi:hypothetical protein
MELTQAMSYAARHAPAPGMRRPEAALEQALVAFWERWAAATGGNVRRQAVMRSTNWPGVGPIDIEVCAPSDRPERAWIEVKWHDLWNCPWDVAKLALALLDGLCDRAFLFAAAPRSKWATPGGEFFAPRTWDMASDVLLAHHDSWLYWKEQVKTRPLHLPSTLSTASVVNDPWWFPLAADETWFLRAIELHVTTGARMLAIDDRRLPAD